MFIIPLGEKAEKDLNKKKAHHGFGWEDKNTIKTAFPQHTNLLKSQFKTSIRFLKERKKGNRKTNSKTHMKI